MPDPSAPEVPHVTCWRDAVAAFRRRDMRVPMVFAAILAAELYLLCLVVAMAVASAAYAWVIGPALTAAFGHVPASFFVQLATGAVVGGPLFWVNVRLMYRAANLLRARADAQPSTPTRRNP